MHLIKRNQVFSDGLDVAAEQIVVERPQRAHGHDFLELVLVSRGSGTHDSGQGACALGRGSVVIMRPGDWHGYRESDALDVTIVYVSGDEMARELLFLHRTPPILRLLSRAGRDSVRPATGAGLRGGRTPRPGDRAERAGRKCRRPAARAAAVPAGGTGRRAAGRHR